MKTYGLISMDPPWNERGGGKYDRAPATKYDTLKYPDLVRTLYASELYPGQPLWSPDPAGCQVWVWTTMTSLPLGMKLIEDLGAKYKTHLVWVKTDGPRTQELQELIQWMVADPFIPEIRKLVNYVGKRLSRLAFMKHGGTGHYVRGTHEICLLGTIGKTRSADRSVPSVLFAPIGEHSEKPQAFYDEVAKISGDDRRLEIFARDRRPGWDAWGNELDTDWRNA